MANVKHVGCLVEGCDQPHRRNGYCANHSQKFKRGTLGVEKKEHLCSIAGCGLKHYAKGLCLKHYRQAERRKISDRASEFRSNYESGDLEFTYKEHSTWARSVKRTLGDYCMLCGWDAVKCDAHHIIPKSEGGLNTLKNAAVLCPNHHAAVHAGLIDLETLQALNKQAIDKLSEEHK